MVDNGHYDWRDANDSDLDNYPVLRRLKDKNKSVKVLEISVLVNSPDTETEIRTGFTNALNSFTTPVQLGIKSASAQDAADGTGMRTMKLFGIGASSATGALDYIEETITLTGQTKLTTTYYWAEVIQAKGVTYGSGGKAAGVITVHEKGATNNNTYLTIAINTLAAINTRLPLLSGKMFHLAFFMVNVIQVSSGNAAALDTGANVRPVYYNGNNEADVPIHKYSALPGIPFILPAHYEDESGNNSNYYTVKHQIINTNANKDVHYDLIYAVW